jgi:glutaminase
MAWTPAALTPSDSVSTGHLPTAEVVASLVQEAHDRFSRVSGGHVADYIPALAAASRDRFGICVASVNSTGLPFNSVLAVERSDQGLSNPMVNAGAIAATSLVPGTTLDQKWEFIAAGLSRFAGRPLEVDREVYDSEQATSPAAANG